MLIDCLLFLYHANGSSLFPHTILGLGSDTFIITPRAVEPVVSKNLRGHRGIIEHAIVSLTDPDYNGLKIRGIQADVLDNDGDYGYISVVDQTKGYHLMSEDAGFGTFTFQIFPTRLPENDIYVRMSLFGFSCCN